MTDDVVRFGELDSPQIYCHVCLKKINKGKESMKRYLAKKFCSLACHWKNKDNWETFDFSSSKIPRKNKQS